MNTTSHCSRYSGAGALFNSNQTYLYQFWLSVSVILMVLHWPKKKRRVLIRAHPLLSVGSSRTAALSHTQARPSSPFTLTTSHASHFDHPRGWPSPNWWVMILDTKHPWQPASLEQRNGVGAQLDPNKGAQVKLFVVGIRPWPWEQRSIVRSCFLLASQNWCVSSHIYLHLL